jgi:prepilin signal peptidase PulO-like enzyme (type II secretory pathway)
MFDLIKNTSKNKKIFLWIYVPIIFSYLLLSLYRVLDFDGNDILFKFCLTFTMLIIFTVLGYLAIFDLLRYEVPSKIVVFTPVIGIAFGFNREVVFWEGNSSTILSLLLGGIISALFIALAVFFSKGKGMGEGDIWVICILGFLVGLDKSITGFYMMIISALFLGLVLSIKRKKFRGNAVPLVPFLVFGYLTAFVFSFGYSDLISIFMIF